MSTTVEQPQLDTSLLQPPPHPLQIHRPSTSCDRHPEEHFTGFCPSCLCERLAELEPKSTSASSSRNPPSITTTTATAALKAIFKPASSSSKPTSSSSFFPELRRTKSFSASKDEGFPCVFEPQRKSCDVRVRGTLWSLFSQEDERQPYIHTDRKADKAGPSNETVEVEPPRVSSSSLPRISTSSLPPPVFEEEEEEDEEETPETVSDSDIQNQIDNACVVEADPHVLSAPRDSNVGGIEEIVEEAEDQLIIESADSFQNRTGFEQVEKLKPMKEHIDLDIQAKKRDFKEIAGSFWSAASVFSKKLQKWRQKQKMKKQKRDELLGVGGVGVFSGVNAGRLPVEKSIGRQFRETQSEVADYGFGRRSCDVDPRFSLDIGRMSFDDQPRYSLDEPRASWDGYIMPGRLSASAFTKMPTMVEDCPFNVIANNINGIVNSHSNGNVVRSDGHIPVEFEDGFIPGGTAQTREYYFDTSSRRRKSLDRSNSIRKTAAAVVAEMDELKSVSNSKITPAVVASDYMQDVKPLGNLGSFSQRDDCSESFDLRCRENGMRKLNSKKAWRWGRWSIWGFIHRRSMNKDEDGDRYGKSNGMVERSFSESWQDLRGPRNGDLKSNGFNPRVLRSHSSVSWRSSNSFGSLGGSARKSNADLNGLSKKEVLVVEKNRSARFSPTNIDNGMLRFYLTPMRGSRRGMWGKGKSNHAHSIARSVLRLY